VAVVDLKSMLTGADSVLVCARVDFDDALGADDVERTCVRLDEELRKRFSDVEEVFVEPVPRGDPELRRAVLERYGDLLSEWQREHDDAAGRGTSVRT
jgi:divalent metal cation (Fe/Co/Zn/Cd) transporter